MNVSEQFAEAFRERHALTSHRFSKAEMRCSKTPDFRVSKLSQLILYCEAKHVQHDD
ncbi:MAG: hypothetical protein NVS1B11_32340 [Terriglobales bacterium]